MNDLAVRESNQTPDILAEQKLEADNQVALATHWAKRLMEVVNRCGMAKDIQGKKYLELEAWQLIGEFAHVTPVLDYVQGWKDEAGKVRGYEAKVNLLNREGEIVACGVSSCGFDAFPCQGKKGSEIDKAARSAAQTWATSKAFRSRFSFVAKLGGFEATTAEEMTSTFSDYPILNECPLHNESWREGKFGKFHSLKGGGFCNVGNVLTAELKKVANAAKMNNVATGEWLKKNGYSTWSTMSNEQKAEAIMTLSASSQEKEPEPGSNG